MKYERFLFLCIIFLIAILYIDKRYESYAKNTGKGIKEFSETELKDIAFPVGGLATGNITLGGRGNISEIEIFNRPAKNKLPDITFFSIFIKEEGKAPISKILERQILPIYGGWMGVQRSQLAGVSRFEEAIFRGEYPLAFVKLLDEKVPVEVNFEAYNPFIPLSPVRSGIPAAIFKWKIKNKMNSGVLCSIAFSMLNPIQSENEFGVLSYGKNINRYMDCSDFRGILMSVQQEEKQSLHYGSIAFVTTEKEIDVQTHWSGYGGRKWDHAHIFWNDFSADGRIKMVTDTYISGDDKSDVVTLLVSFELDPYEERSIPFYLTWHFPLRQNYWNKRTKYITENRNVLGTQFRNFYAAQYKDAWDVAEYLIKNIDDLYNETIKFHDILFQSTYPFCVIDAVSSQMSSLKTNLVMRTEDGKLFGFEGLGDTEGCCPMNCTHVWNYEQALAFLFPSLERTMRETDFLHNTLCNGYQAFRTIMPLGEYWWAYAPCADGQMGNIVRIYREWKISGDTQWLKKLWPKVKAALEFAWKYVSSGEHSQKWLKEKFPLPWDPNKDGVMEGAQHNTYDREFYGPNTMTGSNYLAALKAASEMASALGDTSASNEFRRIYKSGSEKYDSLLWNGEYYVQKIHVMKGLNISDEYILCSSSQGCKYRIGEEQDLSEREINSGQKIEGLLKYQYGDGCLSDQLLGQYLAFVTGLGYVLDRNHVKSALKSIYDYNFKHDFSNFSNVQRVYALNKEAGLILCSWPQGNRPVIPFPYSDEVWTGIEYQVAASLVYAGYIDEGLDIVKAVRDRHSGFNRNPWIESECGYHYARAMSSWALLLALSGYQYDGTRYFIGFSPKINKEEFYTFWSSGTGWGSFEVQKNRVVLKLEFGDLFLSEFGISKEYGFKSIRDICLDSEVLRGELRSEDDLTIVCFQNVVKLKKGDEIVFEFQR